jgi:hypothetical protein
MPLTLPPLLLLLLLLALLLLLPLLPCTAPLRSFCRYSLVRASPPTWQSTFGGLPGQDNICVCAAA